MAYVTPIYGGSAAQIDYRLGITQHGCSSDAQFRYHADGRERPLRWIGRGLSAFGLDELIAGAELTEEQYDLARALMAGRHPGTGDQLVKPKVAVPADAKCPWGRWWPPSGRWRPSAAGRSGRRVHRTPAALRVQHRCTGSGAARRWRAAARG